MERLSMENLKIILIWAAAIAIVVGARPQDNAIAARAAESLKDHANQWQTFVSADEKFSVKFPTEPERNTQIYDTPKGRLELITYNSYINGVFYAVTSSNIPGSRLAGRSADQILEDARYGAIDNAQGRLISESKISKGKNPGRQITAQIESGLIISQFILVGNRLYQLVVYGHAEKISASQREAFFNSFKILK